MAEVKKMLNGLGLVGGCIAGIIIVPFFGIFLVLRAMWRGLYNITHPNAQIPNPESPFNNPRPSQSESESTLEEK